jgi:hypothetical protein
MRVSRVERSLSEWKFTLDLSINTTDRVKDIDSAEKKVGVSFSLLPFIGYEKFACIAERRFVCHWSARAAIPRVGIPC